MRITRIGLTPLKGARHAELPSVRLDASGPVGDRVFCLVDLERQRVLRTVEHPRLVLVDAVWDGTALSITLPGGVEVADSPVDSGELISTDYWGRGARLELLDSPHSEVLGRYLGHDVALARISRPGEVVYGAPVSIATTGALAAIGESDSARCRATFTLEADDDPEPGTELRLGEAVVRVRGSIPRCRVLDINPATGELDRRHLDTLAVLPHPPGELPLGVDAEVVVPGLVRTGDPVTPLRL